ncbi:MAG: BatD family protein, partial [Bacteroidaceae bacterium]|nr:BatD family protein [Bacteroidaceae bacterium]
MMKRLNTILLLLFLALSPAFSQVTLRVQAPSQAEVGQRIRISYVANTQDIEDFQVGNFDGFNVLYGPSTSRSSSFSMTNGHTTQSSTVTFTYTVVPTTEGTHKVPAATIKVEGKSIQSGTASIEVLPASQQQGGQPQNQQQGGNPLQQRQQQNSGGSGQIAGNELYMTVTANRKKIYEQEAVLLTYKLYTLVNIQQISGEMPQI